MSIQIVEIAQPSVIDTVAVAQPSTVAVVEVRQGPVGPAGTGGDVIINADTQSDGTADLLLLNVETATAEVTGTLTAPHIHGNLAGSLYAHVRAAENLAKGDPVYVSGSHGSGATLIAEVSKADASNAAKMPAVGIMDADVLAHATGHMVISGTISDLATNTYSINAELYVAAGGGLTATPPTARAQPVARVERSNLNNGAILVKVNGLSASDATGNTLVRRTNDGGSSFAALNATELAVGTSIFQASSLGNVSFGSGSTINFNGTAYNYEIGGAAALAHRTALGSGATGDQLFTAATPAAARETLEINRTRATQALDLSNATTTFVDTDLVFTLQGGVDYLIRGQFDLVSTASGTGFKLQIATSQNVNALAPTANSLGWVAIGGAVANINSTTLTTADFLNFTGSSTRRAQAEIRINLVATGTVRIRFAQNAGNTTPASVFKAGSFWTRELL